MIFTFYLRLLSKALVELLTKDHLSRRATFPDDVDNREIACHIASRVFEKAVEEKLKIGNKEMMEIQETVGNEKDRLKQMKKYINSKMWDPNYKPLVYQRRE